MVHSDVTHVKIKKMAVSAHIMWMLPQKLPFQLSYKVNSIQRVVGFMNMVGTNHRGAGKMHVIRNGAS